MKQRRAILILGMHRSGTSALSRVLSLRGAELPVHLMSANHGNESGYWEPARIVNFNEEMLGYFGVDWDDPFAGLQIPAADAFPKKFYTKAIKLLTQEYGESDLFVLKDPRCTLLHAFWFAVLAQMKVKVSPVVVMRPYAEVAESLQKRDQANAESSVLLYVAYGLEAAAAVQKRSASFLTYDQLVIDWRAATDRIATEQDFRWPKSSAYTGMEVTEFLNASAGKARKIHLSKAVEGWAGTVWDWFRAKAEGSAPSFAPLKTIRTQLAESAETFSPLLAERRRKISLVQTAYEQAQASAEAGFRSLEESQLTLGDTARDRDGMLAERDQLRALYEATQGELTRTQESYRALDELSARLKTQLDAQDKALGELQRNSERLEGSYEALAAQREALQSERDKLLALYEATHAELTKTQGNYRALEEGSNQARLQLDRLENRNEMLQSERDRALESQQRTDAELSTTKSAYVVLNAQHEQAQAKLQELLAARDALQSERDRLLDNHQRTGAELDTTKSAYEVVRVQHDQAQAKLQELLAARDALQSERDRLLDSHQRTGAELDTTKSAYENVRVQHDQAQAKLQELLALRDSLQAERDLLLENNRHTDAELTATKSAFSALNAQHEQAQATLQELLGLRDALQAERDQLLENHRVTEDELAATRSAYEAIDARHDQAQATLQELLSARDALQAERDRALESQQRTDAELSATKSAYADMEAQHEQAESKLQELLSARDVLQAERDLLLENARRNDSELRAAIAAFEALGQEHALTQVDLRSARDTLQSESERLEQEYLELEAQLAQAHERARLVQDERDQLFDERNSLLDLYRQTDAALVNSNAAYVVRSEELESVRREGDRATSDLAYTRAALDMAMKRADALRTERDAGTQAHEATRKSLAESQQDTEQLRAKFEQFRQRAESDTRHWEQLVAQLKQALNELHLSTSWRVTAPLRNIAIGGRKLRESANLIWPLKMKPMLRLPAPETSHQPQPRGAHASEAAPEKTTATVAAPVDAKSDTQASQAVHVPVFTSRDHDKLRSFLNEEFDPLSADDVILRIDRYRLPIDTDAIRTAARASCSEPDVAGWVDGIARLAAARPWFGDSVDVSIVVPVYNQVQFTLACIESLLAHDTRYSFEILVGDDASIDTTAFAFSKPILGVQHVRHSANLGFVRNCNATASLARGRYIVMLNNDTQVLPNWLDELVGALESDAGIGLSGSKLIYPNGRLQECGGIVWRDGSAWNFGRMDDPRRPEYSYLRDVDYVSGASIALRTDLWRQLGGFDELFVPAYAEDADLAFRVRAMGLRTVVQPLSQILHFEGISSGTDVTQGAKSYQVENLKKLHQRWQGAMASHRANADRPDLEKERGVRRRMLFIDHCTPTPNEDAGSLVAVEIMHAFRDNGFKVTFIPEDNFAHMGATTRDLQRVGIETIYHPSYSSMAAFLSERKDPFDVIFLLRFRVGEAHMQKLCEQFPSAKVIFSNCDLHFLREMREAELSGDTQAMASAQVTQRRELEVIRAADVNLVHSEIELDILHKEAPGVPCTLFPLVHDPIDHVPALQGRDGICFVGGYRHPPNADGIIWFVENVWPLIRPHAPAQKLYIAGSSMTAEVKALAKHANVEIVGFVDHLEAFLAKRRATIAPLRFGAGAKGKIAVSLANGVPVVSTTMGSEGMQLTPGVNILVANSEQALAAYVIEVLSNDQLWHELSAAGLQYASEVTSRDSARKRVRSIIAELGL